MLNGGGREGGLRNHFPQREYPGQRTGPFDTMKLALLILMLPSAGLGEKEAAIAHEAIYRTNLERVKEGLRPLKSGEKEMSAAMWMAQDQARDNQLRHVDSLGRDFTARVGHFGVEDPTGENCAAGYGKPEAVIASWLGSPKHRTNLLHRDAKWVGVGYAESTGSFRHFWTMVLSRGPGFPVLIDNEAPTTNRDDVELFLHGEGTVTEVRISTAEGQWLAWQPFQSRIQITLPPGSGTKRVQVEMKDQSGRTRISEDSIVRS